MIENYYSFFHYCLLSCRYVMFHKSILKEPKWGEGHKQLLGGEGAPGPTVATVIPGQGLREKFFQGVRSRGVVEDTRLEAKAKDTKKSEAKAKDSPSENRPSRGQGQKCSRPRTKDTSAIVLPKNKIFKNFFRRSQKGLKIFFFRHSLVKNAF